VSTYYSDAFALRADGWYLRSDIIWHKPNPMPESVTDRPTKAHEYIFLLSKSGRYYYDYESVREPATESSIVRWQQDVESQDGSQRANGGTKSNGTMKAVGGPRRSDKQRGHSRRHAGFDDRWDSMTKAEQCELGRNKRTVWTVAPSQFKGAHFATFPEDLIRPCIMAGCPETFPLCDCDEIITTPTGSGPIDDPSMTTGRAGMNRPRRDGEGQRPITRREQRAYAEQVKTSLFRDNMQERCGSAFAHYIRTDPSGARPLPPELLADFIAKGWLTEPPPCEHGTGYGHVLDPFCGSGTTLKVARELGRRATGIELNPAYCQITVRRLAQCVLFGAGGAA
jgi:hypothetical protein